MQKNNTIVKAVNKNVRCSPRKLALVLNLIKGKKSRYCFERLGVH